MREHPPTASAALPAALGAIANAQSGVLSRAQLAAGGVDRHDVRAQLRARRWRVVGLAVVLHRGPPDAVQRRWIAVIQTRGRGALAALSALEADGLRGWEREEVHVVVPRGWTVCRVPGLVVHESRRFERERDGARRPGPPRTTSARAAVDGAAWSPSKRTAVGLLAAVAQQRIAPVDALAREVAAAGRVRHVGAMRLALRDLAGGADSLAEIDMAALVRGAGLPEPRRQSVRRDAAGRRRYIDLEVDLPDGSLLLIEVDGSHHLDARQAWSDQSRQNDLAGPGRVLLRFPVYAVRHERAEVRASLRRVRAAHQPRVVSQNGAHGPRNR